MTRALLAGALVAAIAGAAHADGKADAKLFHARGRAAFEAGQYETAIAQFELAYKAYPAPEFLFNLAQVYRKLWRCEARTYLERFLATKPEAREEAAARKILAEVEPKCPVQAEPQPPASQPTGTATTGTPTTGTPTTGTPTVTTSTPGSDEPPSVGVVATPRAPAAWAVSAQAGVAYTAAGDVVMPVVPSFSVAGTRALGPRWLRVGGRLASTPLPYDEGQSGTSQLTALLGIAEAGTEVMPAVHVAGELGLGVLVWTGVGSGNPFTADEESATLVMPHVRAAGAVDFELATGWAVRATPAIGLSPAASKLADDIGVLVTFEGSVGVLATF